MNNLIYLKQKKNELLQKNSDCVFNFYSVYLATKKPYILKNCWTTLMPNIVGHVVSMGQHIPFTP